MLWPTNQRTLSKSRNGGLRGRRPKRAAAAPPPQSDAPAAPEINEPSPVEQAAQAAMKSALSERLQEMDRAVEISSAVARQEQQAEPPQQQAAPEIPEPVQQWLDRHPEYLTDHEKNAALQYHHYSAKRETGEEYTPRYLQSLERHLGLRRQPQPTNGHQDDATSRHLARPAPPRPQASAVPVSAPPTREKPSMSTGRPTGYRAPLTKEEVDLARRLA